MEIRNGCSVLENSSAYGETPELEQLPGTPLYRGDGFYEYRFFYRNPVKLYSDVLQSNRSIQAKTHCQSYNVTGNITDKPEDFVGDPKGWYVTAKLHGEGLVNITTPVNANGMVSWIVSNEEICGPRCAQLTVFQNRALKGELVENLNRSSLWKCENKLSEIIRTAEDVSYVAEKGTDEIINGTDRFAHIAAGAIGWTGIAENGWTDRQYRHYTQGTPWSPPYVLNTSEVEEIIMRFSIGAIAAFDDHGIRHNITINNETCDDKGQKINVSWRYVTSILGAIGAIQTSALIYLLVSANRSIVRDASFFSTAMLLRPVLEVLDDVPGKMALTGAEIRTHKRLRDRNIRYDYKQTGLVKQVTVLFEDEFRGHMRKKWPSGDYSG